MGAPNSGELQLQVRLTFRLSLSCNFSYDYNNNNIINFCVVYIFYGLCLFP